MIIKDRTMLKETNLLVYLLPTTYYYILKYF